jgi:hypothetical protein
MARKTPRKPQPPSDNTKFEMLIRAETDLNVTYRLLWLLVALSHSKGYTHISIARMANQLNTSERQIRNSLEIICAINPRLFRKVPVIGVHRPDQYKRCYLKGEKPEEFVLRAQATPKMDICLGLHWVACSNGKDGVAEFAARRIWPVSREALRQARLKMNGLGYIKVESARARGKAARYILNIHLVTCKEAAKLVEKGKTKPVKTPQESKSFDTKAAAAERNEDRIKEAERAHQQRAAMELGLDVEGKSTPVTGRRELLKKAVPTPPKPFTGWREKEVLTPHRIFTGQGKKEGEE